MTPDPLDDLLRAADAAASPAEDVPSAAFVQAVVRRTRRRRVVRSSLASCVTAAAAVALGVMLDRASSPLSPVVNVVALRREADKAAVRADQQAARIVRMMEAEARSRRSLALTARLSRPGPKERVDALCDRAALSLVHQGERQRRELREPAAAAAAYREAIRLFPQSRWSAVARERLHEMES